MTDRTEPRDPATGKALEGRPRGEGWRDLQADGVLWEGQAAIIGAGADLPVRLIVTTSRIALARAGEVVLDIPRLWLRPAPELRRDGVLALHVLEPGSPYGTPPETLDLRMRDRGATSHLVAMLAGTAGRRNLPDLDLLLPRSRPAFPDADEAPRPEPRRTPRPAAPRPRWDDDEAQAAATIPASSPRPQPVQDPAAMVIAAEESRPVYRPSPPPTASGPGRNWNLPLQEYVVPRSQRRPRWGWTMKLGGLVGLLGLAAALGSGRIASPLDSISIGGGPDAQPTAASVVTSSQAPDEMAASGAGEPDGIGGPYAPGLMASEPGNAPAAASLQVSEGSTETWTEPTAAAPAPALIAPLPAPTMPAAATLAGVGGELPSVDSIAGEVAAALPQTPEPAIPKPQAAPTEAPPPPTPTPMPAPTQPPAPTEAPAPTSTPIPMAMLEPTATAIPEPAATLAPAPAPTEAPALAEAQAAAPALAWNLRMATGGQSLPEFGLPPSGSGNWIVLVLDIANTGDAPATVPMAGFTLGTSAGGAALDPSTDLAAMIAGVTPQWTADDVIELQPGEATRALLLYQVDPAASGMMLVGNGVELPIAEALASGVTVNMLPAPAAP